MSKLSLVALIDADASFRLALAKFLGSSGFEVELFASAEEFLVSRRMSETRCLVIDANLPGMTGLQLQSHLASAGRHIPIVFITTSSDQAARTQALELGALDFLRRTSGEKALLKEILSILKVTDKVTDVGETRK